MKRKILAMLLCVYCGSTFAHVSDKHERYSFLNSSKKYFSTKLEKYSFNIDNYLSGYDNKNNHKKYLDNVHYPDSHANIYITQSYKRNSLNDNININIKLDLPRTKKRYNVFIESNPDETKSLRQRNLPSSSQDSNTKGLLIGISKNDSLFKNWKVNYGLGIKTNLPMDIYLRTKIHKKYYFSKKWYARFNENLSYLIRSKWYSETNLDFVNKIHDNLYFSFNNSWEWRTQQDYLQFSKSLNVTHYLPNDKVETVQVGLLGDGFHSRQTSTYFADYRYKRPIYQKWIYLTMIPELDFDKVKSFRPLPAFTFRLDMKIR